MENLRMASTICHESLPSLCYVISKSGAKLRIIIENKCKNEENSGVKDK